MSDIALVTPNKIEVVESVIQVTLPAAEAIVAGAPVRIDTSSGKFTNSNGTSTAEARTFGIATRTVAAGMPVTAIRKGVLAGFNLDTPAFDADVFVSNTDGRLADAAGTVSRIVGRVLGATATTTGHAFDKLLFVDL